MKLYIETYGCQMNESDSELVRSILYQHPPATSIDEADVILINTCAIRENAHRKIYGRLDTLRAMRKQRRHAQKPFVVGILGCMAQNLKEDLLEHPVVNLIVGPDNYKSLPHLIEQVASEGKPVIEAHLSEYETYDDIAPARIKGVNAWVTVMRGCDNFCTFCVVPYTRGRERCRHAENIVAEIEGLVEAGYPQVTLLGQNVNSYRDGETTFADLILKAANVEGIKRVRFTSPHPKDFPIPLIEAIAKHPHICKHIHLPLQSGSDRILQKMNRTYTRSEYLDLVERIRHLAPGVTLTTDVIVGFPSETEVDFQETFDLMQQVVFDNAFIFKYSERVGTIAMHKFPDDVPQDIKTDRIVRLLDLQHRISLAQNTAKIGQTLSVMIEGVDAKKTAYQFGKGDGPVTILFPLTPHLPGTVVPVTIERASQNRLYGRVPNHHREAAHEI